MKHTEIQTDLKEISFVNTKLMNKCAYDLFFPGECLQKKKGNKNDII